MRKGPLIGTNEAMSYVSQNQLNGDMSIDALCKKASNHHANLPLEMYSFTL